MKTVLTLISILISSFGDLSENPRSTAPDKAGNGQEEIKEHFITRMIEVPVFRVNFYLMGYDQLDQKIPIQINENLEYLNQEFEGRVKFVLDRMVMDPNAGFIPDLHTDHIKNTTEGLNRIIDPIEIKGGINIFLFDTYVANEDLGEMLGFTPILSRQHSDYKFISPQFDRLFISYMGLKDMTTIVHEMGHFLGLKHPWEMNKNRLELMGFDEPDSERNHMTYHPEVNNFSNQQLYRMHHFALNFRQYLLSHIETKFVSDQAFVERSTPIKSFH